jgi:hypothetical protein
MGVSASSFRTFAHFHIHLGGGLVAVQFANVGFLNNVLLDSDRCGKGSRELTGCGSALSKEKGEEIVNLQELERHTQTQGFPATESDNPQTYSAHGSSCDDCVDHPPDML